MTGTGPSTLRSEHWRAYKAAWWRAHSNAVCQVCGRSARPDEGHLDLHHVSRERLGQERFEDCIPLCREDHTRLEAQLHAHTRRRSA
jgi:hypothetical protein